MWLSGQANWLENDNLQLKRDKIIRSISIFRLFNGWTTCLCFLLPVYWHSCLFYQILDVVIINITQRSIIIMSTIKYYLNRPKKGWDSCVWYHCTKWLLSEWTLQSLLSYVQAITYDAVQLSALAPCYKITRESSSSSRCIRTNWEKTFLGRGKRRMWPGSQEGDSLKSLGTTAQANTRCGRESWRFSKYNQLKTFMFVFFARPCII